jgi:hypothetical protein
VLICLQHCISITNLTHLINTKIRALCPPVTLSMSNQLPPATALSLKQHITKCHLRHDLFCLFSEAIYSVHYKFVAVFCDTWIKLRTMGKCLWNWLRQWWTICSLTGLTTCIQASGVHQSEESGILALHVSSSFSLSRASSLVLWKYILYISRKIDMWNTVIDELLMPGPLRGRATGWTEWLVLALYHVLLHHYSAFGRSFIVAAHLQILL